MLSSHFLVHTISRQHQSRHKEEEKVHEHANLIALSRGLQLLVVAHIHLGMVEGDMLVQHMPVKVQGRVVGGRLEEGMPVEDMVVEGKVVGMLEEGMRIEEGNQLADKGSMMGRNYYFGDCLNQGR